VSRERFGKWHFSGFFCCVSVEFSSKGGKLKNEAWRLGTLQAIFSSLRAVASKAFFPSSDLRFENRFVLLRITTKQAHITKLISAF
jgi:hypothetical protein